MSSPPATAAGNLYAQGTPPQRPHFSSLQIFVCMYVLSKKRAPVCCARLRWVARGAAKARNPSRLDCMSAAGQRCGDWAHQTKTPGVPLSAQLIAPYRCSTAAANSLFRPLD